MMGGHIIIRSQIRQMLTDPMNQAVMPTARQHAVNTVLGKDNKDWTDQDVAVLVQTIEWLGCQYPDS